MNTIKDYVEKDHKVFHLRYTKQSYIIISDHLEINKNAKHEYPILLCY